MLEEKCLNETKVSIDDFLPLFSYANTVVYHSVLLVALCAVANMKSTAI